MATIARVLPNAMRNTLRRGINRLPTWMQGAFPAPDLRRQIRMRPLDRDTIDPEWRTRTGAQAATPEEIQRRRDFINYEVEFARAEAINRRMNYNAEGLEKSRLQLAAAIYDGIVTNNIDDQYEIYTDIIDQVRVDGDLINAMTQRARQIAPTARVPAGGLIADLPPTPNAAAAARNILLSQRRDYAFHVSRGMPWPPVGLGVVPSPPVTAFNYGALPDIGVVPVDGDDPIAFEPFVNGEELIIITKNGHQFKYKRAPLEQWITSRVGALTNPITGEQITIADLSKGAAAVTTGGGRRRRRSTRGRSHRRRSTRRVRTR